MAVHDTREKVMCNIVIHCSWSGWNVFTCPSRTLPPEVSTCEDGVLNPAAGRAHLLQSDPVQSSSDGQLRQPLKLSETHQNTNPFLWSSAGIIQLQWYYHTATNNALSYAFQLRYQTVHVLRKKTSYGNVIYDMYCSVTQVILPYMSPIKQYIIFTYVHVLSGWVCVSLAGLIMHCVYDCDWLLCVHILQLLIMCCFKLDYVGTVCIFLINKQIKILALLIDWEIIQIIVFYWEIQIWIILFYWEIKISILLFYCEIKILILLFYWEIKIWIILFYCEIQIWIILFIERLKYESYCFIKRLKYESYYFIKRLKYESYCFIKRLKYESYYFIKRLKYESYCFIEKIKY